MTQCGLCRGSGEIGTGLNSKPCRTCGGTGIKSSPCSFCHGSGYVSDVRGNDKPCRNCNGTGKLN